MCEHICAAEVGEEHHHLSGPGCCGMEGREAGIRLRVSLGTRSHFGVKPKASDW